MTMGEWLAGALIFTGVAGAYSVGLLHGYRRSEQAQGGWEGEALWWRRHATGISPIGERVAGDSKGGE